MIILTVMGGLGNQMFQYAFGRAASLALDRELVLDLTSMPTGRGPHLRSWDLPRLPIATVRQIGTPRSSSAMENARPMLRDVGSVSRRIVRPWLVRDPSSDGVLEYSQLPRPVAFCYGYWQSPRYFEAIDDVIRSELTPPLGASSKGLGVLRSIEGREVIAVHVRRGDYVADPRVAAVHGGLDHRYHAGAIREIAEGLHRPVALVVSDDPAWAVQNLDFEIETMHAEARGPLSSVEALGLMARCTHHVIANSSFSWWGAYLATSSHQRVVYPRRWFADRPIDSASRFPAHWRPYGAE